MIAIFFVLYVCLLSVSETINFEDKLESELDFRSPKVFRDNQMKFLRPFMFDKLVFNRSGVVTSHGVDPFGFARRYWYETRDKALVCPQTPSGIAAHCDWAHMIPCVFVSEVTVSPKTLFVHCAMLPHFFESTLKFMDPSFRFVLVSAGCDFTLPRGFGEHSDSYFFRILGDQRVLHWFVENNDVTHPNLTTFRTDSHFVPAGYSGSLVDFWLGEFNKAYDKHIQR